MDDTRLNPDAGGSLADNKGNIYFYLSDKKFNITLNVSRKFAGSDNRGSRFNQKLVN